MLIDLTEMTIAEDQCVYFRKNDEPYGAFSNMHNGFPLTIGNNVIKSSEALYQTGRYPDYTEIQRGIQNCPHAYPSKRYAWSYLRHTRADWHDVNVAIMDWVVDLKFHFYWNIFIPVMLELKDMVIVERSKHDDFWGAKLHNGVFYGVNALGKIIMRRRDKMLDELASLPINIKTHIVTINPPDIPNFKLFGRDVGPIDIVIDLHESLTSTGGIS